MTKTEQNGFEYKHPEPQRLGLMWWALLLPSVVYSLGVIVYAHNAFVPTATGENGHAWGSLLMVLGGESGTLAAAAEVFRKSQVLTGRKRARRGGREVDETEANAMDWAGLAVSLFATLGNLFVVYVSLTYIEAAWVSRVRMYGPLVLLICSGVDFYANVMEFGFYNASFDARLEQWREKRHAAKLRWEQRQARQSETSAPVVSRDAPETKQPAPMRNTGETKRACVARLVAEGETNAETLAKQCACSAQYARKVRAEEVTK